MQVTDPLGNRYRLGDPLGQGGEGVVYRVHGQPDQAAKLYHHLPPAELAANLAAMATDDLRAVATWPLRVLRDGSGVAAIGYLTPLAAGYEPIHQLYTPKSRRQRFPQADWRFLLRVASGRAAARRAAGLAAADRDWYRADSGRAGHRRAVAPELQPPAARDARPADANSRRDGTVVKEIHWLATDAATGLEQPGPAPDHRPRGPGSSGRRDLVNFH